MNGGNKKCWTIIIKERLIWADENFGINKGGYIGSSIKSEIEQALKINNKGQLYGNLINIWLHKDSLLSI